MAAAIARARGLTLVHLDQLYHKPHTDWMPRTADEFIALHTAAIANSNWVMDGNYAQCLPARLARATGVIFIETSTMTGLWRYLRRSWFESERHGALAGSHDRVTWLMIRHIAVVSRRSRARYRAMFEQLAFPKLKLATTRALAEFYNREKLER